MALLSRRKAAPFFVALLVIAAAETATARDVVDDKHCLSQSQDYTGPCLEHSSCDTTCKKEKFSGGVCKMDGLDLKCMCKKIC